MVVRAIYENGVFRPVSAVELPENTQVELEVHGLPSAEPCPEGSLPLANLAAIAGRYPENPELPADLAANHDQYLYGPSKQP